MVRLSDAWRALAREQRRAALASVGLFVTMFLPWYSKTDAVVVKGAVKSTQTSLDAFQAFSFVEAAVLLVSAGVLAMLFARAERRSFNLPAGDGMIVAIAGGWAAVLIFYRLLDKPGLQGNERISATVGVEWGIFIALLVAISLAYAGWRIRHGERPEPPARRHAAPAPPEPGPRAPRGAAAHEAATEAGRRGRERHPATVETAVVAPPRQRPRYPPSPGEEPEQLSFEDPPEDR